MLALHACHVRRPLRLVIAGLFALGAVLALGALWLSVRPLPLDFAIPALETALSAPDGRYAVEIGRASLVWGGLEVGPALRAEEARVLRSDGSLLVGVSKLGVEISGRALMRGQLAVEEIQFEQPVVSIVRQPDGRLEVLLGEQEQSEPSDANAEIEFVDYLFDLLLDPPDSRLPLRRIRLNHADLALDDRRTDTRWRARDASFELQREPEGVAGKLALAVQAEGPHAEPGAPVPIAIRVLARPEGSELELALSGTLEGLPIDALGSWWPEGVADAARTWVVEHLHAGRIEEIELEATLRMQREAPRNPSLTQLGGRLAAKGLSVAYADGWPAATGIETVGTLEQNALRFFLQAGSIAGLEVEEGAVDVMGLFDGPLQVDVRTQVNGPLESLTRLLALEPLNVFDRIGIDPGQPPGEARASVDLSIRPEQAPLVVANAFSLDSELANARGRFEPAGDGGIRRLQLDPLRVAGNDLRLDLQREKSGEYALDLRGARVDLSPWLRDGLPAQGDGGGTDALPALRLDASLAELELGLHDPLRDVRAQAQRDARGWQRVDFDAGLASEHRLAVTLVPAGGGSKLDVRCDDLGQLLRTTLGYDELTNGELVLGATRTRATAPFEGHGELRNFTLVGAPGLTRLLQGLSLPGLLSALGGKGLAFSLFESDFRYAKGVAELSEAHAVHPSLMLDFDGRIELDPAVADLRGKAIPFESANRLIGQVPVLGGLITGGGKGVLAADFQLQGPLTEPEVSVSPLSALTPTVLRDLATFVRENAQNLVPGARLR